MRKTLPMLCIFMGFTLSACFPQTAQEPQVDYSPTLSSYAVEVNSLQRDIQDLEADKQALTTEKEALVAQITQLQSQAAQSAESAARITELEGQVDNLQSQLNDAQAGLNGFGAMVAGYEEILMGEYYDEDGLMVLCPDAFDVSFGYVDRVSMRKQLVDYIYNQYVNDGYTVDINTITSEHQQIWTDEQDALVKIHILDFLEPFMVTFENPEYGIYSAVYSVRWQCFVDHPVLEARYLALHGNE
ncbi:MAG TPA: hypothetical protein PKL60_02875 [Anaerolineaceae bacterium]|nr:hypothetical protein [Anaerolineaceae bacterium]